MESKTLRVYNRSRESFLNLKVTVVDTMAEPIETIIDNLAFRTDIAFWLKPYRGVPSVPRFRRFDLIYLNEDNRVIEEVDSFPSPDVKPLKATPASALALPAHTVFASRVFPGDQLCISDALENGIESQHLDSSENPRRQARAKESLKARFLRWLTPGRLDRRRVGRHPLPGLVAHCQTDGVSKAFHIGNISDTGLFLLTEERPLLGTILLVTLQRTDISERNPGHSATLRTRVSRWGPDGVGLELVPPVDESRIHGDTPTAQWADKEALEVFVRDLRRPGSRAARLA
jgi:hypothetical protein